MKRRFVAPCAGLLLLLGAMPGSALAGAGTLDQSNTVNTECYQTAGLYAQTFTVGMAGQLVAVNLLLSESPPATVTVRIENLDRSTMEPSGNVLASANIVVGAQTWYVASFSAPPSFLVGARLAIVVNLNNAGCIFGSDESYGGGTAFRKPGLVWMPAGGDYDFKTFMMAPAPTPTPTPTPKPIAIATPTPTPATSSSPTEPPASETPSASPSASPEPSPTEPAVSAMPSATVMPSPGSDSGSGGSTDLTVPIIGAGIVVLGLAAGGLVFALRRRQPKS